MSPSAPRSRAWVAPRWPQPGPRARTPDDPEASLRFHQGLPGYRPTPLHSLPGLAAKLGVQSLLVKDESERFDLEAFKVLGASYAVHRWIQSQAPEIPTQELSQWTFAAATDGNHGRAVAFAARQVGARSKIFLPAHTAPARIAKIQAQGAQVVPIPGTYDDCLEASLEAARHERVILASDTGFEGQEAFALSVQEGYLTLFAEIVRALGPDHPGFDLVFLPVGVGGLASAAAWAFGLGWLGPRAKLVGVEPVSADGLLVSLEAGDGAVHQSQGAEDSIMAGLNCATPSSLALEVLPQSLAACVTIEDTWTREAMRRYARPDPRDPRVLSGESGAASLAGLLALRSEATLEVAARELGLGAHARVLLINTEGATDPEGYRRVVEASPPGTELDEA